MSSYEGYSSEPRFAGRLLAYIIKFGEHRSSVGFLNILLPSDARLKISFNEGRSRGIELTKEQVDTPCISSHRSRIYRHLLGVERPCLALPCSSFASLHRSRPLPRPLQSHLSFCLRRRGANTLQGVGGAVLGESRRCGRKVGNDVSCLLLDGRMPLNAFSNAVRVQSLTHSQTKRTP